MKDQFPSDRNNLKKAGNKCKHLLIINYQIVISSIRILTIRNNILTHIDVHKTSLSQKGTVFSCNLEIEGNIF